MYNRLDKVLLNDLKSKAENPPVKSDEYSKALFLTPISVVYEKSPINIVDGTDSRKLK